jgi:hypothetical protein
MLHYLAIIFLVLALVAVLRVSGALAARRRSGHR